MNKLKEVLILNYKDSTLLYRVLKVLFIWAFSIMLLLDRKLYFNGSIYAKIDEVKFSKIEINDFLFFILYLLVTYIGVTCIEIFVKKLENKLWKNRKKNKKSIKIFFLIFILLIVSWSPYILSSFPGGISGDTGVSINQSIGISKLTNHHPILYTLSIKLAIQLFNGNIELGMALISVLQILIMSLVFTYLIYCLYKKNIPRVYVILTMLFFMFFKLIPLYVMSNWKDSIFSAALLAYIICIMEIIYKDAKNLKKSRYIIKYIIAMFFVAFLRNNGIYIITRNYFMYSISL